MKFNVFVLVTLFLMTACGSTRQVSGEFASYSFNVKCEGVTDDGRQLLRVWCSGQTKQQALDNIRSYAVTTILFNGIHAGDSRCSKTPLLGGANPRERNNSFFSSFFHERKYRHFTSITNIISEAKGKSKTGWCAIVQVDQSALSDYLKENNIK